MRGARLSLANPESTTMPEPNSNPILAGFLVAIPLVLVMKLIVTLTVWLRNALRERYTGGDLALRLPDIVGIPAWLGIEAICFSFALVTGVLAVASTIFLAARFRNWWHRR